MKPDPDRAELPIGPTANGLTGFVPHRFGDRKGKLCLCLGQKLCRILK